MGKVFCEDCKTINNVWDEYCKKCSGKKLKRRKDYNGKN